MEGNMANINKSLLLEEISKQLDISPSMYKLAVERYESVATYLNQEKVQVQIYPQGSFRLGTVTRPIKNGKDSDYDIDLVCRLSFPKESITPKYIKNLIGDTLKENATYNKILDEEGKRCWTLNYAEINDIGFHLDILPSVAETQSFIDNLIVKYHIDNTLALTAIGISDKNKDLGIYSWSTSNPAGFAKWFDNINKPFFRLVEKESRKSIFSENQTIFASVEDVPPQLIRTPLQRVIQILKRHRDVRFANKPFEKDKPISMIITTLVSMIVKNESCYTPDTFTLLGHVVNELVNYAELLNNPSKTIYDIPVIKRDTLHKWYISNPVNPAENFAERWHEDNNKKAKAFFDWIKWVKIDLVDNLNSTNFNTSYLQESFGTELFEKSYKNYSQKNRDNTGYKSPSVHISSTPNKPWRIR